MKVTTPVIAIAHPAPGLCRRLMLIALLLPLTAGCAVTVIDVDVYKGPLVNEKSVQIEQIAVMAIGAKPLLISLRNRLEVAERKLHGRHDPQFERDLDRSHGHERSIDWEATHARRVNEVLHLYEDRKAANHAIANSLEALTAAAAKYQNAYHVLRPATTDRHKPFDEALKSQAGSDGQKSLRAALREMLEPQRNEIGQYKYWDEDVFEAMTALGGNRYSSATTAEARFAKLEDPVIANEVAAKAVDDKLKKDLAAHIQIIARSFRETRESMDAMLVATLHLAIETEADRSFDSQRQPIREQLADLLLNLLQLKNLHDTLADDSNAKQLAPKVAGALSTLGATAGAARTPTLTPMENLLTTSPANITAEEVTRTMNAATNQLNQVRAAYNQAKERKEKHPGDAVVHQQYLNARKELDVVTHSIYQATSTLKARTKNLQAVDVVQAVDALRTPQFAYREAANLLRPVLLRHTTEAARELLAVHQHTKQLETLPYGVARGPSIAAGDLIDNANVGPSSIIEVTQNLNQSFGFFGNGRPDDGIDKMIDVYIRARLGESDDLEQTERKLRKALIWYAQKIVVLVDNEFTAPRRTLYQNHYDEEAKREFASYQRLFQALGNSILVALNELENGDRHNDGQAAAWRREIAAASKMLPADAGGVVDHVLKQLNTEHEEATVSASAALARSAAATKRKDDAAEKRVTVLTSAPLSFTNIGDAAALAAAVKAIRDAAEQSQKDVKTKQTALDDAKKTLEAAEANEEEPAEKLEEKKQAVKDAQSALDGAKATHTMHTEKLKKLEEADKLADQVKTQTDEAARETALHTSNDARATKLDHCRKIVSAHGKAWVANQGHTEPHTHLVVDALRSAVRNHQSGISQPVPAPQASERAMLANTLEILTTRNFDLLSAADLATTGSDPRHVMDLVVSELQHQLIQAEKAGGRHAPQAQRLRDAIETAYNHRASMVHIRPPSAFLKSSYPITSLQNNTGQWDNQLGRHALRSVPFFKLESGASENEAARIRDAIDKQHWQNINRVRVAGGGNTNYVIVKDDLGNWYVKNYSGDPEPIIQGAKAVALAAMSGSVASNLITREASIAQALATGQARAPAVVNTTIPTGAAARFHSRYRAQSIEHVTLLAKCADEFMQTTITAWNNDKSLDGIRSKLNEIADNSEDAAVRAKIKSDVEAVKDVTVSDTARATAIADALGRLRSHRDQVLGRLAAASAADGLAEGDSQRYATAAATASNLMSGELSGFIKKRLTVVDEYQTAMEVLSDTGN